MTRFTFCLLVCLIGSAACGGSPTVPAADSSSFSVPLTHDVPIQPQPSDDGKTSKRPNITGDPLAQPLLGPFLDYCAAAKPDDPFICEDLLRRTRVLGFGSNGEVAFWDQDGWLVEGRLPHLDGASRTRCEIDDRADRPSLAAWSVILGLRTKGYRAVTSVLQRTTYPTNTPFTETADLATPLSSWQIRLKCSAATCDVHIESPGRTTVELIGTVPLGTAPCDKPGRCAEFVIPTVVDLALSPDSSFLLAAIILHSSERNDAIIQHLAWPLPESARRAASAPRE